MEKATLSIFECKPGMQIAETIYNEFGATVIVKDTILDKQILDRIEGMGVLEIEIFIQATEQMKENYNKNLYSKYEQNVNHMKEIMTDLKMGLPLDMVKVKGITDTIRSGIYSSSDIVGPLSEGTDPNQYIYTHSVNVSFMATTIGRWMKCSEATMEHLTLAGLLHDIGKCKTAEDIINKPGKLTDKEFREIEQHPKYAYEMLVDVDGIHKDVLLGILTHHEREDGSGYPAGLTSEKINLVGKILAVADIYDAMTSERHYRERQSPFEVFELMQNGSFGRLHPVILKRFITNMSEHYKGSKVALSNGQEAKVVFINYNKISKPIVNIDGEFIDLSLKPGLKIQSILKNNNTL